MVENIRERFHLNDAEVEFVRRAGVGSALLLAENCRVPVYIQASPEEHRIITTKPDEMKSMVRDPTSPEVERSLTAELDINKPFHRGSQISYEAIQTMLKVGFAEYKAENLEGGHEMFLVKNETNEPDDHFILQQLITDEVKKYTNRVLLHYTTLPDITFETASGEIVAIEVITDPDVGTALSKIEKKMNMLKRYNSYFFVVNNPEIAKHEELGEVLIRSRVPTKIRNFFR
jgi:hypothetical protein